MEKPIEVVVRTATKVKKLVALSLMGLMMIIVAASVIELGLILYQELVDASRGMVFLDISELLNLFSFFFMILIGLEFVETIELYFEKDIIHAEIVLLVAVIAMARKVILLDLKAHDPISIIGFALIIVALGVSYFLIKKGHSQPTSDDTIIDS